MSEKSTPGPVAAAGSGEAPLIPPERAHALVVDDDSQLRRLVARTLKRQGFTVTEAGDGEEALGLIPAEKIDVVVSDISMPEMDGLTFLERVREMDPDLPVILVTGEPSLETAMKAVELGAYQYLQKPFKVAQLAAVATRAAGFYRMSQLKREAFNLSQRTAPDGELERLGLRFDRAFPELYMAFQPIVHAHDLSVFGYEALLRCHDPQFPHPGVLLDAAERLGRIYELGRQVRRLAAEPMLSEPRHGHLFVNLHPEDLNDPDVLDRDTPLAQLGERVVIEITERAQLPPQPEVRDTVDRLRELDFHVAVDDLGAGYAGLTSFAVLQPDIVKIDMTLVRDVNADKVKQKLVGSLIQASHDLGIKVVSEGVETEAERDTLRALDTDLLQGYLIGHPAPTFRPVD